MLFIALNGSAAVNLFFVLSGFVLTYASINAMNTATLLRNAIKCWPRLAGPVAISTITSFIFFKLDFYHFEKAAVIIAKFAYAYETPFQPNFWAALQQGTVTTFFRGASYYNSSLWTMKYEFYGSFIALAIAYAAARTGLLWIPLVALILSFLAVLHLQMEVYYLAFTSGVVLSLIAARPGRISVHSSLALIAIGLYFLGYAGTNLGVYAWVPAVLGQGKTLVVVQIAASFALLAGVILSPRTHAAFDKPFMRFLGWLSFPLYLIHVLILCSFGSWVYLNAATWGLPSGPTAFAATVITSLIACLPLAVFNDLWVKWINTCLNKAVAEKTRRAKVGDR